MIRNMYLMVASLLLALLVASMFSGCAGVMTPAPDQGETGDVAGKFSFEDYHDEGIEPDGRWEIRRDAGIHPFPPDIECLPEAADQADAHL